MWRKENRHAHSFKDHFRTLVSLCTKLEVKWDAVTGVLCEFLFLQGMLKITSDH